MTVFYTLKLRIFWQNTKRAAAATEGAAGLHISLSESSCHGNRVARSSRTNVLRTTSVLLARFRWGYVRMFCQNSTVLKLSNKLLHVVSMSVFKFEMRGELDLVRCLLRVLFINCVCYYSNGFVLICLPQGPPDLFPVRNTEFTVHQ